MIVNIKNEYLSVTVNTHGAEITELRDANDGTKYICPEANSEWEGIAPVLFPNAGIPKDGGNIGGVKYPYRKHGFARDSEFTVTEASAARVVLSLTADAVTKACCPFDFSLSVIYSLKGRTLTVSSVVSNSGGEPMYYSLGFHPGFSCPLVRGEKAEDYELRFPVPATASRMILSGGLISHIQPGFLNGISRLALTEGMFDGGSFSLTDLNFRSVKLCSRVSGRSVRVDFDDYPNLILWAPRNRPFSTLCIEPWHARADRADGEPELRDKPDTITLDPGESRKLSFSITAN